MADEERGTVTEETQTETVTDDMAAFKEELKKAGVQSVEDLQGKFEASKQVGHLNNLLGETRKELESIKQEREASRKQYREQDLDSYSEGQTIDLEGTIAKVFRTEREKERQEAAQAQAAQFQKWNEIRSDSDFALVQGMWDQALKDPNVVYQIQSGQADPVKLYNGIVRQYYKGIAQKSLETIETLQGKGQTPAPHIEQGGRAATSPNLVEGGSGDKNPQMERLKQLREKANKGGLLTEEEELDLAMMALPSLLEP